MFKSLSTKLSQNLKTMLYKNTFTFKFSRKTTVSSKPPKIEESEIGDEYVDEAGNKLESIKVNQGIYPYMPLDDHPLIPGYARMIAISREISEKLKEMDVEKTKLVISVLRNPDKVEGVQPTM